MFNFEAILTNSLNSKLQENNIELSPNNKATIENILKEKEILQVSKIVDLNGFQHSTFVENYAPTLTLLINHLVVYVIDKMVRRPLHLTEYLEHLYDEDLDEEEYSYLEYLDDNDLLITETTDAYNSHLLSEEITTEEYSYHKFLTDHGELFANATEPYKFELVSYMDVGEVYLNALAQKNNSEKTIKESNLIIDELANYFIPTSD